MTNLGSILKSRDIILPTKVHLVKAMVFPVVMYGCESWTVKKAESQKTNAFELWCWRRLLRVPWTTRRSTQYILKEISPGCSLEGLMLKLKLQYFGHLMQRVDSLEKILMLGGIGGRSRRGQQRMRWLDGSPTRWAWVWINSGSWWWTGRPGVLWFMGSQRVGNDWVTELKWTEVMASFKIWITICFTQNLWKWIHGFDTYFCLKILMSILLGTKLLWVFLFFLCIVYFFYISAWISIAVVAVVILEVT